MSRGRRNKKKEPRRRQDIEKRKEEKNEEADVRSQIILDPTEKLSYYFKNDDLNELRHVMQKNDLVGIPVLLAAVALGKFDVVKKLLKEGSPIDCRGPGQLTPLMWVVKHKNMEMLDVLLRRGADANLQDDKGDNPLHMALQTHTWDQDSFLDFWNSVKDCETFDLDQANKSGFTILHYATKNQWKIVLNSLLEKGANVNCATSRGVTPLMMAASRNHNQVVTSLLNAKANVLMEDERCCTALCYTIAYVIQKHLDLPNPTLQELIDTLESSGPTTLMPIYIKRRLEILVKPPDTVTNFTDTISNVLLYIILFFVRCTRRGINFLLEQEVFVRISEAVEAHMDDLHYIHAILGVLLELLRYCSCCYAGGECPFTEDQIMGEFVSSGGANICLTILKIHGRAHCNRWLMTSAMLPLFSACPSEGRPRLWLQTHYKELLPFHNCFLTMCFIKFNICADDYHVTLLQKKIQDFHDLIMKLDNGEPIINNNKIKSAAGDADYDSYHQLTTFSVNTLDPNESYKTQVLTMTAYSSKARKRTARTIRMKVERRKNRTFLTFLPSEFEDTKESEFDFQHSINNSLVIMEELDSSPERPKDAISSPEDVLPNDHDQSDTSWKPKEILSPNREWPSIDTPNPEVRTSNTEIQKSNSKFCESNTEHQIPRAEFKMPNNILETDHTSEHILSEDMDKNYINFSKSSICTEQQQNDSYTIYDEAWPEAHVYDGNKCINIVDNNSIFLPAKEGEIHNDDYMTSDFARNFFLDGNGYDASIPVTTAKSHTNNSGGFNTVENQEMFLDGEQFASSVLEEEEEEEIKKNKDKMDFNYFDDLFKTLILKYIKSWQYEMEADYPGHCGSGDSKNNEILKKLRKKVPQIEKEYMLYLKSIWQFFINTFKLTDCQEFFEHIAEQTVDIIKRYEGMVDRKIKQLEIFNQKRAQSKASSNAKISRTDSKATVNSGEGLDSMVELNSHSDDMKELEETERLCPHSHHTFLNEADGSEETRCFPSAYQSATSSYPYKNQQKKLSYAELFHDKNTSRQSAIIPPYSIKQCLRSTASAVPITGTNMNNEGQLHPFVQPPPGFPAYPLLSLDSILTAQSPYTTSFPSLRQVSPFQMYVDVPQNTIHNSMKAPAGNERADVAHLGLDPSSLIVLPGSHNYISRWKSLSVLFQSMSPLFCHILLDGSFSVPNQIYEQQFKLANEGNLGYISLGIGTNKQVLAVKHLLVNANCSSQVISCAVQKLIPPLLQLRHRHILSYLHCVHRENKLYLTAPLCEYNLGEYIMCLKLHNKLEARATDLVKQFLSGLHFLHTLSCPVIHGNLKPSNVLVDEHGILKVADFGLHLALYHLNQPENSSIIWWARETHEAFIRSWTVLCTCKSDIQVAGMLVHFIITGGLHPFGAEAHEIVENVCNGSNALKTVSCDTNDLISWMIVFDPKGRPGISEVMSHVFFWDILRKWKFVLTCCGIDENGESLPFPLSEFHLAIDYKATEDKIRGDWVSVVKETFPNMPAIDTDSADSPAGLLRFIRTCVEEKKRNRSKSFSQNLQNFFLTAFPSLPLSLYRLVSETEWKRHPVLEYVLKRAF